MPDTAEPGPGTHSLNLPPYEPTVPNLIRAAVDAYGDRELAVLGDHRMTYADADADSAAIAKGLLAIGVGKGTRVGLLAPNGPRWIAAWLAIGRIGALGVLLNTYYKARELDWVLRHADVQVLLGVSQPPQSRLPETALRRLQPPVIAPTSSRPRTPICAPFGCGARPTVPGPDR